MLFGPSFPVNLHRSVFVHNKMQLISKCMVCFWQVLGCHAHQRSSSEEWPSNYPFTNGTGCSCHNTKFNDICIASCASNITDHEVRQQYGAGTITVTCSAGNYVLGCGIKPRYGVGPEKWRSWAVKDVNTCECYDNYGATCYAICGQLT